MSIAIRKVDEQILILELKKNGHNITIVGVYAPSEDANPEIKEEFYGKMTELLESPNNNQEIYILGVLNGRIGRKENYEVVRR